MSNELRDEQTIAIDMAIGDALGWPNGVYDATDAVLAAIAAMTPSSQTLRRALGALHVVEEDHYGRYCKSCSTNDRRVSDPCPTHRVLREFDMGNLLEIPDSSTLNVLAEARCNCGFGGVHEPLNKRCALNGHDVLAEVRDRCLDSVALSDDTCILAQQILAILDREPTQ